MKYDFVTIGGATEDIAIKTTEAIKISNPKDIKKQRLIAFKYGAKMNVEDSRSYFGGGAANAAVNFAGLGFATAIIACLGNDPRGEGIIGNFVAHKVDPSLLQRTNKESSGFSFLIVGTDNEHVVFSSRAANKYVKVSGKEVAVLNQSRCIYLTSLSGDWQKILSNVFKSKAKISWNPGHRQLQAGSSLLGKYLRRTDVLLLNKDEAIELVYSSVNFRRRGSAFFKDTKNLLLALKSFGPRIVSVTSGREGADVYDGQKFYHKNIIKETHVADTTGVGDCFGSTFVAGLDIFNGNIEKAMQMAMLNTASVVARPGAQNGLLKRKELMAKAGK